MQKLEINEEGPDIPGVAHSIWHEPTAQTQTGSYRGLSGLQSPVQLCDFMITSLTPGKLSVVFQPHTGSPTS